MGEQEREIQELKQALLKAYQDIDKLSKVKSDFVSIVSHELRTPLTSIKESVSLVLDGIAGPINVDQKNFLAMAKNNIDRLVKIVSNILDFSKMESGRITMHKRKMNVNDLIKETYASSRADAEKESLGFEIELSDEVEMAWLDPDRIAQVLKNLISNAIKFNKPNGSIKISSANGFIDARRVIKISVEDTGIGIPEEEVSNLFKVFNPLDVSMTRSRPGIGLGLPMCEHIINFHGGDIWVESREGKGSKFIFTLPIYERDDEFNFLLDESIQRARHNDMKLGLIIFGAKEQKDASEEVLVELERVIQATVRGPEDKVTRFRDGGLIALMAGTDRSGAMKIIARLKDRVNIPLNFGVSVYPDEAEKKEDLINRAEEDLRRKRNAL